MINRHVLHYPLNDPRAMHAFATISRHLPLEEIVAALLCWDTSTESADYLTMLVEDSIHARPLPETIKDILLTLVATDVSSQIHLACEVLWPYYGCVFRQICAPEVVIAEIIIVRDMVLVDVFIEED